MNRRQFAFWLGFGLFSLSEKFHLGSLDRLAAATMRAVERKSRVAGATKAAVAKTDAVHWTLGGNDAWRWYERENLIKGNWRSTGITTPINKKTGERKWDQGGYLDESLLPEELRANEEAYKVAATADGADKGVTLADDEEPNTQLPTAKGRGRHGRPPSKWLRSLHAYELRTWLKTVDVPEAGVSGMTVWTHLTRDHLFDAGHIRGLSVHEQHKLHAAAHFGY
jgi:hypothetical protein